MMIIPQLWPRRLAWQVALSSAALSACVAPSPTPPKAATERSESAAGPRQVTVLFLADLHAQLNTHPELFLRDGVERIEPAGGVARLATAIAAIRRERPGAVLLVDGGDTIQGSGVAALTEGAAIVKGIAPLGIDVGVPGNWEVVYGTKALLQRSRELAYPLVAANVKDTASSAAVFAPYVVREVGGVRVAVVGFTDPDVPRRQPPAYSAGFRYEDATDLPAIVERARSEGKADIVLLATHIGLSKATALAKRLPSVDVNLSADTHERTYRPIDVDGRWVVEPGAFGSLLGRLDLWVENGRVVNKSWKLLEITAKDYPADATAQRVVDEVTQPFQARLGEVVGETTVPLMRYDVVETGLDAVLSDALREASGTEIGLSNGFRFGVPLVPGAVRESDLWDVYPMVAKLKVGRVTGKQLRDFWEQELENVFAADPEKRFGGWVPRPSGLSLRFVANAPAGHRLRELRVGQALVTDNQSYTITACDREGDAPDMVCRIHGARDVHVLDFDAHEAVRRYLKRHRPITAPARGRVVAEDLPSPLRTQETSETLASSPHSSPTQEAP